MSDSTRATIEITASSSRLARGLATASRMMRGWGSAVARGIGSTFSAINKQMKLGDTAKNAAGHFLGGLAQRGLDKIVDGANEVRDFERNLVRYQITTNGSAASTARMRREVARVSRETAIARGEVLAGASTYVALTGDVNGASTAMESFARIAQASGSSTEDIATAAAALQASMGLTAKDLEPAFSSMIVQGKAGAVELKDMAQYLATLAPQFAQFRGGRSVAGLRELGAAFQVIRTGAGSAGEAATNLESLLGALAKPEVIRKLEQVKIKIFDKDPKTGLVTMRNASDIFEDIAKNQKLVDPRVIAAIFGRKEAQQAIRSIRDHIDMYRQLKEQAKDTGAVQRDLNTYLKSDAGKLDQAINNLKVSLAEAFTPERIKAFTAAIAGLAQSLGPVVASFGKILDAYNKLYKAGQAIRGFFDAPRNYDQKDFRIINSGGFQLGADNSDKARAQRVADAKARIAEVRSYDDAAERINNAATPDDQIKAAFAAKYNAKKDTGAMQAGTVYLQKAGVSDPVAVAYQTMAAINAQARKERTDEDAKILAAAIVKGLQGLGIKVDIGKDKVVDGVKSSQRHATGVSHA